MILGDYARFNEESEGGRWLNHQSLAGVHKKWRASLQASAPS